MISRQLGPIGNTVHREGLKSCSARKVPLLKKAHVQPVWSQWLRGELGESVVVRWDQNPALWHQLNSPCLEEEECCLWPQEHIPTVKHGGGNITLWGVFLLRGQTTAPHQRDDGRGIVPSGHWKWVVDGYSSRTMTQNTRPRQQRSDPRRSILRSWSGLASVQTFIPK